MAISEQRRRVLTENNATAKREARSCIKTALLALLEQESYENIRMTDIIQKSGVSRAGVYKNYKSKDEIMLDILSSHSKRFLPLLETLSMRIWI